MHLFVAQCSGLTAVYHSITLTAHKVPLFRKLTPARPLVFLSVHSRSPFL